MVPEALGRQSVCLPGFSVRINMKVPSSIKEETSRINAGAKQSTMASGWCTSKEEFMSWRIWPRIRQLPEFRQQFADKSHQVGPRLQAQYICTE